MQIPTPTPVPLPAEVNFIQNSTFTNGTTGWLFTGSVVQQWLDNTLLLNTTDPATFAVASYATNYSLGSGVPFEIRIALGSTSDSDKAVLVKAYDLDNPASELFCFFSVPAETGLRDYAVRDETPAAWNRVGIDIAVLDDTDGFILVDNVTAAAKQTPDYTTYQTACVSPAPGGVMTTGTYRNGHPAILYHTGTWSAELWNADPDLPYGQGTGADVAFSFWLEGSGFILRMPAQELAATYKVCIDSVCDNYSPASVAGGNYDDYSLWVNLDQRLHFVDVRNVAGGDLNLREIEILGGFDNLQEPLAQLPTPVPNLVYATVQAPGHTTGQAVAIDYTITAGDVMLSILITALVFVVLLLAVLPMWKSDKVK